MINLNPATAGFFLQILNHNLQILTGAFSILNACFLSLYKAGTLNKKQSIMSKKLLLAALLASAGLSAQTTHHIDWFMGVSQTAASAVIDTILNPDINSSLLVVEGENVLGNEDFANELFSLYPNPAKEMITINGSELGEISEASIYDLSGRLVASPEVADNVVNIQSLAKGTYVIIIKAADGKQHSAKFIKG